MDISWGSDVWLPVRHRASKEWSKYLLLQACSTSVSGQIDLTGDYTLQLQLDLSFVTHHYTSGSGLSFCAERLRSSGTLPRPPPRSPPHSCYGDGSVPNREVVPSARKDNRLLKRSVPIKATSPASSKGKVQARWMSPVAQPSLRAPVWTTPAAPTHGSLNSGMKTEDIQSPPAKQHRKVTYLTYSTILIPASKLPLWKKIILEAYTR